MPEAQTSTIIKRRSTQPVPKKSQTGYLLAALAIVVGGGFFLAHNKVILAIIWFLGIGLGLILQ